jgi:5-methylcytosine-specific restriction endonuclease McrA
VTDERKAAARARYLKWLAKPGNRDIANARAVAHRRAHPEMRQMYEQRRRALKLGRFVENVDRRVLLERFAGLCGWCREPVNPADFHVDHIVAIVHGGEHSYANTQPVHPACNYEKRTVLKERAA